LGTKPNKTCCSCWFFSSDCPTGKPRGTLWVEPSQLDVPNLFHCKPRQPSPIGMLRVDRAGGGFGVGHHCHDLMLAAASFCQQFPHRLSDTML